MSAEPTLFATADDDWIAWEGEVINGIFPLHRFLGGSDHSAVFLTECRSKGFEEATVKLIPANTVRVADQLAQWRTAAAISHPNIVRILDLGRCLIGGEEFLFIVTEYAEQVLTEVLAGRALSAGEVRELLRPALEALAFLHERGLVHSRLKPSNLLAVNDQLKIAGDTIRPEGADARTVVTSSVYDAPELSSGKVSACSDIWALGVTMVEAITQNVPVWADSLREAVRLPANVPLSFAGIVQRCLAKSPDTRPTAAELTSPYKSMSKIQVISTPLPPVQGSPPSPEEPGWRSSSAIYVSMFAIAGALVMFLLAWTALR
jgi:serine/threonine-protein kinase